MLKKIEEIIDKFTNFLGNLTAILLLLMLLNVFIDVIMRYLFKNSSIGMQEMEWHLFSIVFLFGMAYTLKENGHVRVDIFYDNLKPERKAIIDIVGAVIFIIPFSLIIIKSGYDFSREAYEMNEMSGDPGGLPFRFIIKGAISLSFIFLIFSTISFILHNIGIILESKKEKKSKLNGGL